VYRNDRTEKRSRGQVIQIGRDNAGDCSIMSKDVPGGLELDLSVMNMTARAIRVRALYEVQMGHFGGKMGCEGH